MPPEPADPAAPAIGVPPDTPPPPVGLLVAPPLGGPPLFPPLGIGLPAPPTGLAPPEPATGAEPPLPAPPGFGGASLELHPSAAAKAEARIAERHHPHTRARLLTTGLIGLFSCAGQGRGVRP